MRLGREVGEEADPDRPHSQVPAVGGGGWNLPALQMGACARVGGEG